jgi:hypothetical protein
MLRWAELSERCHDEGEQLGLSGTNFGGCVRGLALLVSLLGAASICSARAITWTLNGTFNDGGAVSGTFVFDPDLGASQTISTFNFVVSGGNTSLFFPFNFTPVNSFGAGPVIAAAGSFQFDSNATYTGSGYTNQNYVLQFVPVSPLSDAGGVVNINLSSSFSNNCFDCNPFRVFVTGTVTGPVSPPATPAPPTLLLVFIGLGCAVAYAARDRLRQAFQRKSLLR